MELTFADTEQAYSQFANAKDLSKDLVVSISGGLKQISALDAIDAIVEDSFRERAELVRKMLMGNNVAISLNGQIIWQVMFTEGYFWETDTQLSEKPYLLRFLVTTVYGQFLKKFIPTSND